MLQPASPPSASSRELRNITEYGNRLTGAVQNVLLQRFQHRNRDGSWFQPRVIQAVTALPYLHYVVVDPSALWHYSKAELLSRETLDAISGAVGLPVQGSEWIHNDPNADIKSGIVYGILLKPLPRIEAPALPAMALLALENPVGDLKVPVGRTGQGERWERLDKLGHMLIVGATGSGKSTWLHAAFAGMLTANAPKRLQVALIDPKRSEFALWDRVPHLWREIAHDPETATFLVTDVVDEINRRGDAFTRAQMRDIAAYNRSARIPLPYLVVVVDECLDLVLEAGQRSQLVGALKTIAMRGRGAGVFLWAATQHASAVDGLPRVINVNLMTRLVFRVADADAARRAGCPGAETISANLHGRMLARVDGEPVPLQGFYVPDEELGAIAQRLAGMPAGQGDDLTDFERELLAWAVRENAGALTIADIAGHTGIVGREARRIAEGLERRGLAMKDRNQRNQRVVSEEGARRALRTDKLTN